MSCPCCSQIDYELCCKRYHSGSQLPPTAYALMRSRYSAYAVANCRYIISTTHPESPYFEKNREKWEKALFQFSRTTKFLRLKIIDYGEDWVHFVAELDQGKPFDMEEKSQFQKLHGKWLYVKKI